MFLQSTFGFVTFCFVVHVMSVLFFFSVAFLFCLWLVYQVASGSKLTSETPMEELSLTLARYVRIEGIAD